MIQKTCFYLLISALLVQQSFAQQFKPEVVVFGSGPGAIAAGIQSARSGVKTLLIGHGETWGLGMSAKAEIFNRTQVLESGIWAELLKHYPGIKDYKNAMNKSLSLRPDSVSAILQLMSDTVKNLSIQRNEQVKELKKTGKGWDIRLSNGQKIKARILLDATSEQVILKKLDITPVDSLSGKADWNRTLYRTSVAVLDSSKILPIGALITKLENVVCLPPFKSITAALNAGQAAGATAAFCAFFKTDTKNLNIRTIQSELLTYRSSLIPFGDVLPTDTNFIKIQHLAVSGIMNAGLKEKDGFTYWMRDNTLSTEELRLAMKTFYSRSQIWFADHKAEKLSIAETINLLMYTATRGEELRREIEKGWKDNLGFTSNYDPKRPITRWEFAILLDTYLQPFNSKVDLEGQLLN